MPTMAGREAWMKSRSSHQVVDGLPRTAHHHAASCLEAQLAQPAEALQPVVLRHLTGVQVLVLPWE